MNRVYHITVLALGLGLVGCGNGGGNENAENIDPCNTVLAFNDTNFNYYTTANNTLAPSNNTELELMPDDLLSVGSAVFLKPAMTPPYSIEFEYTIFDDDGESNVPSSFNSADGIVVMLAKDETPYDSIDPPFGGARGYHPGDGYGVHFSIYETRYMSITDGAGDPLAYLEDFSPNVYPHGEWRKVKVTVRGDSIVVDYADNTGFLTYNGTLVQTYDRVGIGAGTGGADGQHKIRNVKVCSL